MVCQCGTDTQVVYYAGLRRSSYGFPTRNDDDEWWAARAQAFAEGLSDVETVVPVIIQIVSVCQPDGTTQFGFEKPANYRGSTEHMTFYAGTVDHERALDVYDQQGIKAVIQFEAGNADVLACLEIAHLQYGRHLCIIGYGVDAEWYQTAKSVDGTGVPVENRDVRRWIRKVRSFDASYTLFIKHWDPAHMPPRYRHPNLWFLSDSQRFGGFEDMMTDFRSWSDAFSDSTVGYQYGYPSDQGWWREMESPSLEIGEAILDRIPNAYYLFWTDFAADELRLGSDR